MNRHEKIERQIWCMDACVKVRQKSLKWLNIICVNVIAHNSLSIGMLRLCPQGGSLKKSESKILVLKTTSIIKGITHYRLLE
jgi:hypothetical protein